MEQSAIKIRGKPIIFRSAEFLASCLFLFMAAKANMDVVPGIWILKIISPIPKIMMIVSPLARRIEETMNSSVAARIAM
jgi:hypothetical protein